MLICAAAVVPMHVVTSPPLEPAAEEEIMAAITRADDLIKEHKQNSVVVIDLMHRLKDDDAKEYDRKTIESLLSHEFQTVLLQHGVRAGIATRVASMWACNTVSDIHLVLTRHGACIVVYFRCGSVQALYDLDGMITTGFVRAVFTEVIHTLTSSTPTVDVYVKPDDFDFALSSLTSPQDTGLFWELK